jgi:sugar phosphate isomerase/epimerase
MYLSLSSYGGVTTRQALETIAAAGIHNVELAIGVRPDPGITATIHDFQHQGMVFRAHHAFLWESSHCPFNLSRPINHGYFERMVRWLATCGIDAYSVHPGSYGRERTAAWQQLLHNLQWLQHLCQQQGIVLAVETMYPGRENNFLGSLSEIIELRQQLPTLQWVLDLSHLNLWPTEQFADRLETIERLASHLLEIHISDNDGLQDRHGAITDRTWWLPWRHLWPSTVPYVLETRLNRQSPAMLRKEYQRIERCLSKIN